MTTFIRHQPGQQIKSTDVNELQVSLETLTNPISNPTPVAADTLLGTRASDGATVRFAYPTRSGRDYNALDYASDGTVATLDAAAINACIAAASGGVGGQAKGRVLLPGGSYNINATIDCEQQYGLELVSTSPFGTRLVWTGAAGGTMLLWRGIYSGRIDGLLLKGDGTTTGIDYDAVVGGLVSTKNQFNHLRIEDQAFGARVGRSGYQTDQTEWRNVTFARCATAGTSIEDANAVIHNFYDCYWDHCGTGITAIRAGTGGNFNLFGCGFTANTAWSVEVYPSSYGTMLSACWMETGAGFLRTFAASTATTVTLDECCINTFTAPATERRICQWRCSGALNVKGGRYKSGNTALPPLFTVQNPNNLRANILVDGAVFAGDPFTGATELQYATVLLRNIQYDEVMDATRPGPVSGVLPQGSPAAPIALNITLNWQGAAWIKIPTGTVLAAGINSFAGASWQCQGRTLVTVTPYQHGGLLQPYTLAGRDTNATTNRTFAIDVIVATGFTLTADLIVHVQFEPGLATY